MMNYATYIEKLKIFLKNSFVRFIEEFQEDLKLFAYWCLVFTVFRLLFIVCFSSQLNGNYAEVPLALFLGFRLSLVTTGIICLFGFVLGTLIKGIYKPFNAKFIRWNFHNLFFMIFAFCFMARIPYYQIFNATFNMMLVNGLYDDKLAILQTAIEEYQLLWRLPVAILLGYLLSVVAHWFCRVTPSLKLKLHWSRGLATLAFLPLFAIFTYYGGAFTVKQAIYWESAARLHSHLLNEAILDDGQALWRTFVGYARFSVAYEKATSVEEACKQLDILHLDKNVRNIDTLFKHSVAAPKLAQQPSNIILLVGESFGVWPFLDKYAALDLVPNLEKLGNAKDGVHIKTMLASGDCTIVSLNALITGLPHNNIREHYHPNSFKNKYAMGVAYILKQMGYKTVFWYGGYADWQNVQNFALAQSFDEYHGAEEIDKSREFAYAKNSYWGISDELFLQYVQEYIKQENSTEKVFHLIMTTSNHPPYPMDLEEIGFPSEQVRAQLTDDFHKDDDALKQLGHIWYADKTMGEFVERVQAAKEDTLFVITGDHSERTNFAKEQDAMTKSAVPCIFYGKGVRKDWFGEQSVGSHMQIPATLAEIAAPSGFTYSALQPSMFAEQELVFNYAYYADAQGMHPLKELPEEKQAYMEALKKIAIYRVLKGDTIE